MKAVKVTLPRDLTGVKIHTFADWHIGDNACDIAAIKDEIQVIKDCKQYYVICNGDLMNNATKTSVSDCYAESIPPMEQLQQLCELLEPIKDKILILTQGNHEARTYRNDGIDLTALMAKQLGIYDRYVREGGVLFLRLGECLNGRRDHRDNNLYRQVCYSLYVTHGSGGGKKIGGKANVLVDKASIVDTDIYIIGHHHTPFTTRQSYFRTDLHNNSISKVDKLFVCTAAKLEYGGYGETFGYTPSSIQNPVIFLSGTKKHFTVKS